MATTKTTKTTKTAARKTTKSEKRVIKHPGARVWRLPIESVREPLKAYRDAEGVTVKDCYRLGIERAVRIADELVRLGLTQGTEECGPVRVLHTDEELAALHKASAATGVDMRLLLIAGLRTLISESTPPARRGRRRS